MLQTDTSVIFLTTFCPFTPLATGEKKAWRYYHFAIVYHKWQSYDDCFQRYGAQQTEFFVILGHFLPFYPTNNLKNQNFEEIIIIIKCLEISSFYKSVPKIMIIFHKCTKNHDHMLYCSWDVVHDRYDFYFLFWTIFCPFTPLKIKI